jgi:CubicO group peptidase (beta-lactamase class C family)
VIDFNEIKTIIEAFRGKFSGAFLISHGGETLMEGACGMANLDFDIPNKADTKFDTASVTKVFTAAAILLLVQQGKLKMSDRITDLVDLRGSAISPSVTIGHLLTHTSGISDDADEEAGEDYAALFVHSPNYAIRQCADFLPNFAHKEPRFEAGTDVRYNNCAFILLGLAIEAQTGMDARDYITQTVFHPCGMMNSCFQAMDEVCPNTATGYFAECDEKGRLIRWRKNIYSYPLIGTPDGGAYTTVGDLHLFMRAVRTGALLDARHAKMLMEPCVPFIRKSDYGVRKFGHAFEILESNGQVFCQYKEGINSGVAAMLSYYPPFDIGVYLLSNQDCAYLDWPLWTLNGQIRDLFFKMFKAQSMLR